MPGQSGEMPKGPEARQEVSKENTAQYVSTTTSRYLFAVNPGMLLMQIDLSVMNLTNL